MSPIQTEDLDRNIRIADASATIGQVAIDLREAVGERLAAWFVIVLMPDGLFAVLTAAELNQVFETQGERALARPLQSIDGLLEPSLSVEQEQAELDEALRLSDLSHRQMLVVLKNGTPVGLLRERSKGQALEERLGLFESHVSPDFSPQEPETPRWIPGQGSEGSEPDEPEAARWIQGQVYDGGDPLESKRLTQALRAGARHLLVVRIGPADEEWLQPLDEQVFPEHELNWQREKHTLRVVFSEPNHAPQPQMATIILPREGPSTTCQFSFETLSDVPTFQGRVIVLHRNRVLQTAILKGPVVPDPADAPQQPSLQLNIESVLRPNLSGLEDRPQFDLALVANHTAADEPALTSIADEWTTFQSLENIKDTIDDILALLSTLSDAPELYPRDLMDKNNVELLSDLAFYGSALYDGIVSRRTGTGMFKNVKRVQLVSARDEYLPLEFLYDLPPPRDDAALCPNALQALEDGACADCGGLTSEPDDGATYVCPLGFWCMRLVIERHAIEPGKRPELDGDDFAIRTAPLPGRNELKVLGSAVYAASERVDTVVPEQSQEIFEALQAATQEHTVRVSTWDEWVNAVENGPSLLVLLPHTSRGGRRNWPQLEIGGDQPLLERYIEKKHVLSSQSAAPPVVLLLGCETLAPDVGIGNFTVKFQMVGASIVLSTLTAVLGRNVGPIVELLIQDLDQASISAKTFGDAMLNLRRHALSEGLLTVLCLVAHGAADWQLRKA